MDVSFFAFVLIPTIAMLLFKVHSMGAAFSTFLHHALVFSIFYASYIVCTRRSSKLVERTFAIVAATYGVLLYFLVGWIWKTGGTFDAFFLLDSVAEVLPTASGVIGLAGMIVLFTVFAIGYAITILLVGKSLKQVAPIGDQLNIRAKGALTCLILFSFAHVPQTDGSVLDQMAHIMRTGKARNTVVASIPDHSMYTTDTDESVFILQLESLNAFVQNGNTLVDDKLYMAKNGPVLERIAKDGIYFPYFWANAIQTNRAQASILCGIINNLGDAFGYEPQQITTDCLPEILRKTGHKTIFLSSHPSPNFQNKDAFMASVGFRDRHHADFMEEEDEKFPWGYDDCTFYKRAFDYIENTYSHSDKKFVYLEVSANHVPFTAKKGYESVFTYPKARNFVEKYSNSVRAQDKCLEIFYERFKQMDNGKAHLIILPDTSWPVGINGNAWNERDVYNDNMLIPLVYIPPRDRKDEFYVGTTVLQRFSQNDIIPTIFDVLNGRRYDNSFAFELSKSAERGRKRYEDCHLLTQPYAGGAIAIVKGDDKYIYSVSKKTLTYYDLSKDIFEQNPQTVGENMEYEDLVDQYYCNRFKQRVGERIVLNSEATHLGDQVVKSSWKKEWQAFKGQKPAKAHSFTFQIKPGTLLTHIEISGYHMDGGHPVYLNGEMVGYSCSTGKKQWTCRMRLEKPVQIIEQENHFIMLLKKPDDGNWDDLIVSEVGVLAL